MSNTKKARAVAALASAFAALSALSLGLGVGGKTAPLVLSSLAAASALAAALLRGRKTKHAAGTGVDTATTVPHALSGLPGNHPPVDEAEDLVQVIDDGSAAAEATAGKVPTTRERALATASALHRLGFADAILGKVPAYTEEAAFFLMERLVALRDQSAKAAEAAEAVEQGATNAELVAGLAKEARESMLKVQTRLAEMRKHDRDATSGLKALGEELKAGIDLLAGIEEITERSRLIAFNMAIEAARIGEKGRGFKVIVGELRALNDRTVDFSRQVTSLLERFKMHNEDLVESAIASSLRVAEEVDAGVAEEEKALESLLGASTACLELSDSVTDSVKAINKELDRVLESLQFQDITRQMIEGALLTMAEAEADIASVAPRDGDGLGRHDDARLAEAIRAAILARAKTKGEKEAIQEVRK